MNLEYIKRINEENRYLIPVREVEEIQHELALARESSDYWREKFILLHDSTVHWTNLSTKVTRSYTLSQAYKNFSAEA